MDIVTGISVIVIPSLIAFVMSLILNRRNITATDNVLNELSKLRINNDNRIEQNKIELDLEIQKRRTLEFELEKQFAKYAACIDDLTALKMQVVSTQTHNTPTKTSIKFLSIWPGYDNVTYEKLDQENEIKHLHESVFDYTPLVNDRATRTNIVNELDLDGSINIILIGGHGTEDHIVLSKNNGKPFDLTPINWFVTTISKSNNEINLVLLFTCTSDKLADALYRSGINCVLGFRSEVEDRQIIAFLQPFYKYLAGNKSVVEAMELAIRSFDNTLKDKIVLRGNYKF